MIGPLPYIGGKNRLAVEIISLLPEHTTYVEPFAGGAQVLFHKAPSRVEVLNDLDFDIVNFFRVCQWHHDELMRLLRYLVVSRKLHGLYAATNPETLTDIQRAARFFYLLKNSYGGLVVNQHFHYGVTQSPNYNPERIPLTIEAVNERLRRVQIECLPYEQVLEKYDRTTTCFYLDPPYYKKFLYKFNLEDHEFVQLAERLKKLKGKFILSLNDHPEVRRIFQDFHVRTTSLVYTAKPGARARYGELLIANFTLEKNAGVS